ncbi:MAG TPA: hypothetical protein VG649_02815 [Candidatus Angelobacter sp.]|nr:hypothetical protein [Candidatus Angelobacter sp.]
MREPETLWKKNVAQRQAATKPYRGLRGYMRIQFGEAPAGGGIIEPSTAEDVNGLIYLILKVSFCGAKCISMLHKSFIGHLNEEFSVRKLPNQFIHIFGSAGAGVSTFVLMICNHDFTGLSPRRGHLTVAQHDSALSGAESNAGLASKPTKSR